MARRNKESSLEGRRKTGVLKDLGFGWSRTDLARIRQTDLVNDDQPLGCSA